MATLYTSRSLTPVCEFRLLFFFLREPRAPVVRIKKRNAFVCGPAQTGTARVLWSPRGEGLNSHRTPSGLLQFLAVCYHDSPSEKKIITGVRLV